jgi:hypothetical protein
MNSKSKRAQTAGLLVILSLVVCTVAGAATFTGSPDPVQVCDGSGLAQITLSWDASDTGAASVDIHIGTPTGPLFASAQPVGTTPTGKWVTNDTTFLLINPATNQVLAQYKARLSAAECPVPNAQKGIWGRILGWFGR